MIHDLSTFALAGEANQKNGPKGFFADQTDLIVLDLSLRGVKGFESLRTIRATDHATPILALAPYLDAELTARVLQAGAQGVVTYQEDDEAFVAALERVASEGRRVPPQIQDRVMDQLVQCTAGRRREAQTTAQLSDREIQVFHLLGQGYGSGEIGSALGISDKTVHAHRESIKRKLGLSSAAELIHKATLWLAELRQRSA
jgi:DNA-binding NarL/FixJ family response regulator